MKRKIVILIMCFFCLVGCSSSKETKNDVKKKEKVEEKKSENIQYQYHYSKLGKKDKKDYDKLYKALIDKDMWVDFKAMDEKKITKLFSYVLGDHPEIFYSNGRFSYSQVNEGKAMEVTLLYNSLKEKSKKIAKQLETMRNEIMASITVESDYEKVKAVYDYITQNFVYNLESKQNQNLAGGMLNKETVCAGYAKAAQYILLGMGIDTTYIEGQTTKEPDSDEGHAWNMVKLNGDYYYFDTTWGDVAEHLPHTCYNYFLMSEEDMLKMYIPRYEHEPTTNINETWSIHNGTYLTSWNSQVLSNLWVKAINEGKNYIEIKCSPEVFADFHWRLESSGEMYNILSNLGLNVESYHFIEMPELNTFDIYY